MIVLSVHTKREMVKPGVTMAFIESALATPDLVTPDKTDPTLVRSYKAIIEFGGRALRVAHRPEGTDVFVVTAHRDREVKL